MRYPFASLVIQQLAPAMGIRVELEPEFGFAGELIFPSGRRHVFRNTNFNVNPAGSTEIAKDKGYTCFFLRKHGFPVPANKTFFSERLNANLPPEKRRGIRQVRAFAQKLGLPVFVKPNNLSQGTLVTKVYALEDIAPVCERIFERTDVLLIEEVCSGRDFRIVVLGEEVISAYERLPLTVVGDGLHSIDDLLQQSQRDLLSQGRPNSEIDPFDFRVDLKLKALGVSRSSVPAPGERVELLDNANLSTGGTSRDMSGRIHDEVVEAAVQATKALGLTLCGVDLLAQDPFAPLSSQRWTIIELNAAPGLDNYAAMGAEQSERVGMLYMKILEFMARS